MPLKAKFVGDSLQTIQAHYGDKPIELYLFLSMGENRRDYNVQTGKYFSFPATVIDMVI